jgi:hypothetical protein
MTESEPQARRLGYARVSTYGQTLDAQVGQLRKAGCTKIYREKMTGVRSRPDRMFPVNIARQEPSPLPQVQ